MSRATTLTSRSASPVVAWISITSGMRAEAVGGGVAGGLADRQRDERHQRVAERCRVDPLAEGAQRAGPAA